MRTPRILSTLAVTAGIAALSGVACSSTTDKKGLDRGGTGGTASGKGGSTMVAATGGSSGSGGTDSGTGAAAGDNGVAECGELAGLGKCGGTSLIAEFRTVNMLLVIDKSGSMDDQPKGFDQ